MTQDVTPTYHPAPSTPQLRLPAGACDAHCHVFGPTAVFPYADDARFRPADAPKERLFALHDMIGIERCVIVQSGGPGPAELTALAPRLRRLGWHLQIHLDSRLMVGMAPLLATLDVPVVIDHMARLATR